MKLFLFPNYTKPKTAQAVEQVLRWASLSQVGIVMEQCTEEDVPQEYRQSITFLSTISQESFSDCRCIVTVGGDGTVVRAAKYSAEYGLPLAGINTGTLGFLAHIEMENLEKKLEQIYNGDYRAETRLALSAQWAGGSVDFALNDIVLQKAVHDGLAGLHAYYGEGLVGKYRVDGLILSTPTGSTAYSCAAGGPVLDPALEAISMIPICPQNRMNLPFICASDKPVVVKVQKGTMHVIADGNHCGTLNQGEQIVISPSSKKMTLVRLDNEWGVDRWQKRICLLD